MSGAFLAGSLILAILTIIETATSKLCQTFLLWQASPIVAERILFWHGVLLQVMTAIKLYHLSDGLLLSFNPGHSTTLPKTQQHQLYSQDIALGFLLRTSAIQASLIALGLASVHAGLP